MGFFNNSSEKEQALIMENVQLDMKNEALLALLEEVLIDGVDLHTSQEKIIKVMMFIQNQEKYSYLYNTLKDVHVVYNENGSLPMKEGLNNDLVVALENLEVAYQLINQIIGTGATRTTDDDILYDISSEISFIDNEKFPELQERLDLAVARHRNKRLTEDEYLNTRTFIILAIIEALKVGLYTIEITYSWDDITEALIREKYSRGFEQVSNDHFTWEWKTKEAPEDNLEINDEDYKTMHILKSPVDNRGIVMTQESYEIVKENNFGYIIPDE